MGIRTAMAGQYELRPLLRQQLCGLDTGTLAERDVRVLNGLSFHRVRLDDEEVRASAEAGVNVRIQIRRRRRDCYSHDNPFLFAWFA